MKTESPDAVHVYRTSLNSFEPSGGLHERSNVFYRFEDFVEIGLTPAGTRHREHSLLLELEVSGCVYAEAEFLYIEWVGRGSLGGWIISRKW